MDDIPTTEERLGEMSQSLTDKFQSLTNYEF